MASYKLRCIREKLETVFETDAAPAAANSILCRNLTMRALDGDWQEQDFVNGMDGAQPEDLYGAHCSADYEVEAIPSGTRGTAPIYAHLLKSSGLSEVVSAGASVAYSPTPKGQTFASTTLQMTNGQIAQNVVGCRGSMSFTAEVKRRAFFSFQRRGRFGAPTDYVKGDYDFVGWGRALECTPENMHAFTLGGTKLCVRSFSLSDGRSPVVDKYMNCGGSDITGHRYTGRMQVKWPSLATKDLIGQSKAGTTERLIFEIGKNAGQKIRITGPKVQIKFASEENIDGDLGASLDLVFLPEQGDDDVLIEFL
ncbi:phage tail tube protein [Paracoccus sp. (in: a-proteobacteria)]|uniref:phage tail tube protein n=1 Tax=Paracoccus sp. TaxID=267 RepID=UPI0026E0A9D9|nr:phage tail tube protein [Paracoccus sp. (in: a-proteobacteria)]MDO5648863.1 hypothetical protein [Paracoccus sp. (in: a-proteobacteria)]